jgi:uncharacterized membrane protein YfcA
LDVIPFTRATGSIGTVRGGYPPGVVSAALVVFVASIAAGGFGSLVGIGGGLIIVPVLTTVLGYDIKVAIAASLIGVIATSVAASGHFLATGIADRRLAVTLLVATALGGLTGGLVGRYLDARVLALLFGLLLLFVAVQMIRQLRASGAAGSAATAGEPTDQGFDSSYVEPTTGQVIGYRAHRLPMGTGISYIAGNISGLLGVGGGIINVPTMTVVMGVPIRVATTTSTFMLGATAVTSAMLNEASGRLDPLLAAPVALGVFLGARSGALLSRHVSPRQLRIVFVGVALFFAAQMFLKVLGS